MKVVVIKKNLFTTYVVIVLKIKNNKSGKSPYPKCLTNKWLVPNC